MKRNNLFFIDTEFNGLDGALISMALVPADEGIEPFYAELTIDYILDPWVRRHVYDKLDGEHVDFRTFQHALERYINQFEEMTIMADWPDDIVYFNKALITGPGTAINTPPLSFVLDRRIEGKSTLPHHALYDAKANMQYYFTHLVSNNKSE